MVEKILVAFVCVLLVLGLLEVGRLAWAYLRRQQAVDRPPPPAAPDDGSTPQSAIPTILRLIAAALVGFFLGAVTAGILEEIGYRTIAFGSFRANTLIAIWTALVWLYLSRRDANKAA